MMKIPATIWTTSAVFPFFWMLSGSVEAQNQKAFDAINQAEDWNLVLNDPCTEDWTEQWTLDGRIATVGNTVEGMHFSAGPEAKNDAHHAVLWTKESYEGDIKIEYDYIRNDSATKYVTILYIQATGDGEGQFAENISEWNAFRQVPAMRKYFENMNLLHVSYAAFGNNGDGFYYVRARRYPKPEDKGFNVTRIEPSYDYNGYFKTGQEYHITAIKSDNILFFKIESADGTELLVWDLSDVSPVNKGRVGLRHMYTRSAVYKNFKIYTKD
ncbi:YesU family protein [Reichenbachiella ulvae]|uniref:YesU family protein n=1 Tax=Reichenbachiella ulvae TaxID=2980104 RepID=A0ABT3CT01_9BACT|nr:YesU family protein [Reichenbachiella ulvae]MCV9386644.1 YesU family protein [Reichenbachiella ulvae]